MKVGLFFGSFNPIHIGHIAVANLMAESTGFDQVWLVVSPRNPLKNKGILVDVKKRLTQVKKAIGKSRKINICNVELSLPQPSYTIHTLAFLKKKYPKNKFSLIMGSDNLNLFHKWKDYKEILARYTIYVYPRFSSPVKRRLRGTLKNHPNIKIIDAPLINISSTFIREQMKKGKNVRRFLA